MNIMIGDVCENLTFEYRWLACEYIATSLAYPGFEFRNLIIRKSIGLGDNGNEVNLGVKPTHKLDIERLQPG